jgi:hypothetical protein
MNLRHRSTTNIPPYRVSRYLACHVPRLAVSKAASRATALAQTIPAQGSRLHKRIIAIGVLIMIWLQVSIDPNNSQGLKMINEVDIAWNEEWTGISQTGFLSLDGNRLTIRTL